MNSLTESGLTENTYLFVVLLIAFSMAVGIIILAFLQKDIHDEQKMFDESDIYNDDLF